MRTVSKLTRPAQETWVFSALLIGSLFQVIGSQRVYMKCGAAWAVRVHPHPGKAVESLRTDFDLDDTVIPLTEGSAVTLTQV